MRQSGAVEIVFTAPENLRLVLQAAKRRRVQDAVAVDLEWRAVIAAIVGTGVALRIKFPVKAIQHRAQLLMSIIAFFRRASIQRSYWAEVFFLRTRSSTASRTL